MSQPDARRTGPQPPRIPPPPTGPRPFWSVMVPAYEPSALLERALRSVLDQDPGPGMMQIAVVDDRSPTVDVEALLRRVDPAGRVEYHRGESNLGLAGNWNRCIALARGRWVHLLHQDDLVFPTFYERLARADAEAPEAGAAFCQHASIDAGDRWHRISPLERPTPGVLDGWLSRIVRQQWIQCASIVVRRDVYEAVGGYREDLVYVLDWEMYVRIAAGHSFWYEPTILACYRTHDANETSRLRALDRDIEDAQLAAMIVRGFLPEPHRSAAGVDLIGWVRGRMLAEAAALLEAGDLRGGMVRFEAACRRSPGLRLGHIGRAFYRWALKLWARRLLAAARPGPRPTAQAPAPPRGAAS